MEVNPCYPRWIAQAWVYLSLMRGIIHYARNLFKQGKEHVKNHNNNHEHSFMMKHQRKLHQFMEENYTAKVTGTAKRLSNQTSKGGSPPEKMAGPYIEQ